jgi:hypothetical protein
MIAIAMRTLAAFVVGLALAACQVDEPDTVAPGTFDPGLSERQRSLCEADGGRWGAGGTAGSMVCYRPTRDANQSCRADGDCEGLCLARSRTCTPVTPFFGCHEVLNSEGVPQTLCID